MLQYSLQTYSILQFEKNLQKFSLGEMLLA